MAQLEVCNPVAKTAHFSVTPAARRADLRRVTVGLYWNMKAGGDAALDRTEQLMRERFPEARFKRYHGSVGFLMYEDVASTIHLSYLTDGGYLKLFESKL